MRTSVKQVCLTGWSLARHSGWSRRFALLFLGFGLHLNVEVTAQEKAKLFRVLGYGDGVFEGIYFDSHDEGNSAAKELRFVPDRRSIPYRVPKTDDVLSFYAFQKGENDEPLKSEVGRVRVDFSIEKALIIFLESPGQADKRQYEILVFDESPDNWGGGAVRFLNLSGASLTGKLGERSFQLGNSESEFFEYDDQRQFYQRLDFTVSWQRRQRLVYSSMFTLDRNYGKLVVIKPPLDGSRFKVRVATVW